MGEQDKLSIRHPRSSNEDKLIRHLNMTEKRAIVQQALTAQGFRTNEIAHLTNISPQRVVAVNKKIAAGTLNPMVGKAKKAVKMMLQGKKFGDISEIRGSDVLTAAKMVLDRVDPIVNKNENLTRTYTYELKAEDRDRYKKALGIIDAEFTVIPGDRQKDRQYEQKLIEGSANGRPSGFEPESEGSIPSPSTNNDEQTTKTGTDTGTTQDSERVQDSCVASPHN